MSKYGISMSPVSTMSLWIQSGVSKANIYEGNFLSKCHLGTLEFSLKLWKIGLWKRPILRGNHQIKSRLMSQSNTVMNKKDYSYKLVYLIASICLVDKKRWFSSSLHLFQNLGSQPIVLIQVKMIGQTLNM